MLHALLVGVCVLYCRLLQHHICEDDSVLCVYGLSLGMSSAASMSGSLELTDHSSSCCSCSTASYRSVCCRQLQLDDWQCFGVVLILISWMVWLPCVCSPDSHRLALDSATVAANLIDVASGQHMLVCILLCSLCSSTAAMAGFWPVLVPARKSSCNSSCNSPIAHGNCISAWLQLPEAR